MEKNSTLGVKEIAKLSGVSIGTVDRVLHNRPGVAAKTKEKVLAVLENHQYEPNLIGRALSKKKPIHFVAIIPISSPESAYWDAPKKGIIQALDELKNYEVKIEILLFDQNNRLSFDEQVETFKSMEVDGLVLAPTFLKESLALSEYCDEKGILYTYLNSDLPDTNNIAYFGADLFQTGYLAGRLLHNYGNSNCEFLIIHISKEMENNHHLIRKEEGLRAYFTDKNLDADIKVLHINDTNIDLIAKQLSDFLKINPVKYWLVTNSRVSSVAKFIQDNKITDVKLIGFDFLPENVSYLKSGIIDFLICHKPIEQGFNAVMALFQKKVLYKSFEKINFMPIDVICKENYMYYEN